MMKKLILSLAVAIGLLGSCNSQSSETTSSEQHSGTIAKNVGVNDFKKLVDEGKGLVLDVRTPEEVAEGAIEGSKNINFYGDNFKDEIAKLDKNQAVYVYCRSGGRSGKTMQQMKEMGFKEVYNLNGGITAWKSEGYKTK